jgi:hypothetical protein
MDRRAPSAAGAGGPRKFARIIYLHDDRNNGGQ